MRRILLTLVVCCFARIAPGRSAATPPVQFRIMTETVASLAGARVRISAELKNISNHPIMLDQYYVDGVDMDFRFHLSNGLGAKLTVKSTKADKSLKATKRLTLEPGRLAGGLICLSCVYGGLTSPGKYTLYLSHNIVSDGETITVKSNKIAFRVVPKQSPGAPIPLAVELSLPKTAVAEGALVAYDVTLINRSNHDLDCGDVYMDNVDETYRLQIVDAKGGDIVPFRYQIEASDVRGCTLPFGETKHWEAAMVPSAYPRLAPGIYTLRIATANPDDPRAPIIQSNPVSLTIQPVPINPHP